MIAHQKTREEKQVPEKTGVRPGISLVIGNLIIGIFEGLLLAWFCGLRKLRGIAVMVLANFCSVISLCDCRRGPVRL